MCAFFLCVFFFKQKTAYEMRISDWSSDVCSSDLALRWFSGRNRGRLPWHVTIAPQPFEALAELGKSQLDQGRDFMIPRYSRPEMAGIWEPENKLRIWFEIEAHACDAQAEQHGRESCRERECPNVYISVLSE